MKAPLHSFGKPNPTPYHLLQEEMTMNRRYTIAGSNTKIPNSSVWPTASRSRRGAVETTASTIRGRIIGDAWRNSSSWQHSWSLVPCWSGSRRRTPRTAGDGTRKSL